MSLVESVVVAVAAAVAMDSGCHWWTVSVAHEPLLGVAWPAHVSTSGRDLQHPANGNSYSSATRVIIRNRQEG